MKERDFTDMTEGYVPLILFIGYLGGIRSAGFETQGEQADFYREDPGE